MVRRHGTSRHAAKVCATCLLRLGRASHPAFAMIHMRINNLREFYFASLSRLLSVHCSVCGLNAKSLLFQPA